MKVFYKIVTVEAVSAGYGIALDDRPVKTPLKAPLAMPTKALAEAVAGEWRAQTDEIDTKTMPLTQLASTAIDRVAARMDGVAEEIAAFAGTDLLCYRADEPKELFERQNTIWQPYLDWAEGAFGAGLQSTSGIMPVKQDAAVLDKFTAQVKARDAFMLTALHELTGGFGSLVLALAYLDGFKPFDDIWTASILDQTHQEEAWGVEQDAEEQQELLLSDLRVVCRYVELLRADD
ncbi:MAG: ATPase [Kordiimonadales bacterium]|nr:MAG: ATPase [Kordiimonadales bacterium]